MTASPIAHDELLQQMGWVQALARSLVRDPNVADDVAQEAFFTALERPPRTAHSGASLRAWLAAVTRTLARQSVRSETRRRGREERAARPEAAPTDGDVVERGEVQRDLVAAVLELPEPYRSTVLHRYLDGLSGPEIAERAGVGHAAVRQRLSRGLKQLRERLDERHGGDCRAWLLPLALPALGAPKGAGLAPVEHASSSLFGAGTWLAAAAAVVLVGTTLWVGPWWRATPVAGPIATVPAPFSTDPALGPSAAAPPVQLVAAVAAPRDGGGASAMPDQIGLPPVDARLSGRVVDGDGAPVADLRMRFEPDARDATTGGVTLTAFSDGDGRFVIDGVTGRGRVLAANSRWTTLLAGDASPPLDRAEPVVVVSPAATLAGRVVNAAGAPLAGARVAVSPPAGLEARVGADLSRSWPNLAETTTDAHGAFHLARASLAAGARLTVHAVGYREYVASVPPSGGLAPTVVLEHPPVRLTGRVMDPSGAAVPGARVGFGDLGTTSDGDGAFVLHLEPGQASGDAAPPALVAGSAEHQPVRVEAPRDPDTGWPRWPAHLDVTLGPPPARFTGRVVDAAGAPVHGARVWLTDPTPLLVESLEDEGAVELASALPDGSPAGPHVITAEQLLGGRETGWRPITTGADGAFTLPGVAERPYVLAALAPGSLCMTTSAPAAPGDGPLLLRLPDDELRPALHGRLVDRLGRPVAGADVSLRRPGLTIAHTTWWTAGRAARSDAQGRFRLGSLDGAGTWLRVQGEGLVTVDRPVPPAAAGEVEFLVPARRELRLNLSEPIADAFEVLDITGTALLLADQRRDRLLLRERVPLRDGRSPVLVVSDEATTLVLLRGDEVVDRRPLHLLPDEVHVVR